jgi:hypothetical protein
MALVQLVWNAPIDDHPRPRKPLWERFAYPQTRLGLLVWRDGTVLETDTLERVEEYGADLVISGVWYGQSTDWPVAVLTAAGYTLVSIPATNQPITGEAMTTVGDLVSEVRAARLSVGRTVHPGHPYNPGDRPSRCATRSRTCSPGMVSGRAEHLLRDGGQLLSGNQITVQPGADGGPTVAAPFGEVIRIKPAHTTWAIYREWCSELLSLSSPQVGLYGYGSFQSAPSWKDNVYPLPDDVAPFDTADPIRLLQARYQIRGYDQWQKINGVEWQPEQATIRVYGMTPNAVALRFVFAFPFGQPDALTDDIATLGMSDAMADIPGLGVAATLSLTDEARRNMVAPQGDPRRAGELPPGANINVSRMFQMQQQSRIGQESARLLALFGYSMTYGVSGEAEAAGWGALR